MQSSFPAPMTPQTPFYAKTPFPKSDRPLHVKPDIQRGFGACPTPRAAFGIFIPYKEISTSPGVFHAIRDSTQLARWIVHLVQQLGPCLDNPPNPDLPLPALRSTDRDGNPIQHLVDLPPENVEVNEVHIVRVTLIFWNYVMLIIPTPHTASERTCLYQRKSGQCGLCVILNAGPLRRYLGRRFRVLQSRFIELKHTSHI